MNMTELITTLTILVKNDFKEQFDKINDFIITNSSMSTQANFHNNWDIKYVDDYEYELTDEVSIQDYDDIEMLFTDSIISPRTNSLPILLVPLSPAFSAALSG